MADVRITQEVAEALVKPSDSNMRVTQFLGEALIKPTDENMRVTQLCIEVVFSIPEERRFGPAVQMM